MLSKQFLLATTDANHPNHCDLNTKEPRVMKETLKTKFKEDITHLIPLTGTDPPSLKAGIKNIHTESVATTIRNQPNNQIINAPAPPINKEERTLGRKTRSTLSQLRSGYSSSLYSYLNRINPLKYLSPLCPDCSLEEHTTPHLFECSAKPTDLTPWSLWESPVAAAEFLGLEDQIGIG